MIDSCKNQYKSFLIVVCILNYITACVSDVVIIISAPVSSPCLSKYELNYVTSFKGPCLSGAFSRDGKLAACGSDDLSIKVIIL